MMRQALCVALISVSAAAMAGQRPQPNPGPNFVSAAELKQAIADAKPWPPDPSVRYKRLGAREGYSYWVLQRDATGKVEQHDDWTDTFVIQSGEVTMLTGGQIKGGEHTGPGETLGGEIVGGQRQHLGPNDLYIVPAGTPHQFVIEPGRSVFYITIKTARGGTR